MLETTLEENLSMIADSVRYLQARRGLTVFFDAEHFFDGYKANPDYALRVPAGGRRGRRRLPGALRYQRRQPARRDNGGGQRRQRSMTGLPLGIHAHNDGELAVANTLAAVAAGATQVQGTINGYGERCGNANLCSIIPDLKLKMGIDCVTDEQLAQLTEVSHFVSEAANLAPDPFLPYVGASAFSHKAGLHVSGMTKWDEATSTSTRPRWATSSGWSSPSFPGKSNIIYKAKEMGSTLPPTGKEAQKLLEQVKQLESRGFQYENAEASFELLLHRAQAGLSSRPSSWSTSWWWWKEAASPQPENHRGDARRGDGQGQGGR